MLNLYLETYLYECYFFEAVFGKAFQNDKLIFDILGKSFMLEQDNIDEIYQLSNNPVANYINSESDFLRYSRIKQYIKNYTESETALNEEYSLVASVKGKAYADAGKLHLLGIGERSKGAVITAIVESANAGTVMALKMLGIMECEGLLIEENLIAGVKKLKRVSEWNDVCATLYNLYYGENKRSETLTRLRDLTKNGIYKPFYDRAKTVYNIPEGRTIHEVSLLEQVFNSGIASRECCDQKYSRVISSKILSIKDKERIVFSSNKQLLTEVQCLPLKLKDRGEEICSEFLNTLPVTRDNEIKDIQRALVNSDLRTSDDYQPLCICTDEKYLLNEVVNCFEEMTNRLNVVKIEAEHLSVFDIEPTGNNVFIRSCDEDKDNVFLITLSGNIPQQIVKGITDFLQSEKREKFLIAGLGIELNVSLVLPIVFCDKQNLAHVKNYCEVVTVKPVTQTEKQSLIMRMAIEKADLYKVDKVVIEADAVENLVKYSVDTINVAVDRAVRNNRVKHGEIHLTAEHFKDVDKINRESKTTFGFGG